MHSNHTISEHWLQSAVWFSAISVPTSIGYVGEQQTFLTLRLRYPGLSKKILKKRPFCTRFCAVRFRLFLDEYRINRHKTWHALPVGTHKAGITAQWNLSSLPET